MTADEIAKDFDDAIAFFPRMLSLELGWLLEDSSTPEPNTGCILWTDRVTKAGYGWVDWRSLRLLAHRAAFQLVFGEVPHGVEIHHRCEQPSCINVRHLVPLTSKQHNRVHAGLGALISTAQPGSIDVFDALIEIQNAAGLGAFPIGAIARHHSGRLTPTPTPDALRAPTVAIHEVSFRASLAPAGGK